MDEERFDELVRAITTAGTRRKALKSIASGALASALGVAGLAETAAKGQNHKKHKKQANKHKHKGQAQHADSHHKKHHHSAGSGSQPGDGSNPAPTPTGDATSPDPTTPDTPPVAAEPATAKKRGKGKHNRKGKGKKGHHPNHLEAAATCASTGKISICHCVPTTAATACNIQCISTSGLNGHKNHEFDCLCGPSQGGIPQCADQAHCTDQDASACCPVCPPNTQCCTNTGVGACVDTKTDPANCGSCGHACSTGQTCSNGQCIGCTSADQCPHGTCETPTCNNNQCGTAPIDGCCTSPSDCGTPPTCKTNTCIGNVCGTAPIDGCCTSPSDCGTPPTCKTNTCIGNVCGTAPIDGCCTSANQCPHGTCETPVCSGNVCSTTPIVCPPGQTCDPRTGTCRGGGCFHSAGADGGCMGQCTSVGNGCNGASCGVICGTGQSKGACPVGSGGDNPCCNAGYCQKSNFVGGGGVGNKGKCTYKGPTTGCPPAPKTR